MHRPRACNYTRSVLFCLCSRFSLDLPRAERIKTAYARVFARCARSSPPRVAYAASRVFCPVINSCHGGLKVCQDAVEPLNWGLLSSNLVTETFLSRSIASLATRHNTYTPGRGRVGGFLGLRILYRGPLSYVSFGCEWGK